MKTLGVTIWCQACYNSAIEIPDNLTKKEAIQYANDHIKDIPLGQLSYVEDSDSLDEENCHFIDENGNAILDDDISVNTIEPIKQQIRQYLNEIHKECSTLPENFGDEILMEVTDRFIEDGYEITKQTVLEELLWCYMIKMQ